ncbi:MAG: hypothetical protein GX025_05630 [Clostridiales bacterium]|nr:hypothetical protein [Clostridiales bacterium]
MKKLLGPLAAIILTILILYIANFLPTAIFNSGRYGNREVYVKTEALDSLMEKGAFLGRALKRDVFWGADRQGEHGFRINNSGNLDYERKKEYFAGLAELIEKGKLPGFLSDEMQKAIESAVAEKIELISDSGKSLPLIHIYYEWISDWSNWMEIYIDEETGKTLYAYFSGSCLNKGGEYASDYPEVLSLEELSLLYTDYMGYSIENLKHSENPNENALILTCSDGSREGRFMINLIYYAGTMYDVKISPQP